MTLAFAAAAGWMTPRAAAAAADAADPDDEVARRHLDRGRALAADGHCDQAVDELQRGRVIKPLPEFALALGRCYDALEDRPRAVSWYRSYLKATPDDAAHGAARAEVRARLTTLGPELATPVTCVTSEALGVLAKHHWPGNIRELRNATRRAMAYCDGNAILAEDLPAYLRSGEPRDAEWSWPERLEALLLEADAGELPNDLLGRIEDRLIPAILRKTGGNKLKTAQILGLAINTLRKRIKDHQPVAVTFVTAGRGAAGIV